MSEHWVPVSLFFFSTVSCCLIVYWWIKLKEKKLETIVKIVESGDEVKPEMIRLLGQKSGPINDLRKGLIWLAIGLPLTLVCFFSHSNYRIVAEQHASRRIAPEEYAAKAERGRAMVSIASRRV